MHEPAGISGSADELHRISATDALRMFRGRVLSPVELMRALVARAEAVEPRINAFAERMFEQALEGAREAEARYAPGRPEPRPLEGLAVAAKEELPLAGRLVTHGSMLGKGEPAEETSWLLARVVAAGGILHARTTTSEFCCMPLSHAPRWGVTRNPWNAGVGAGGSSGGSAASLASGTSTLATGSDVGGSLRAPASFNGVVGFKPPHGRNPLPPPTNLETRYHQGPLARTVADCALLQNVLAGPHPLDATSLRPALRIPERLDGPRGLRVAFSDRPGDFPVDPGIRANTRAAAEALSADGAIVEEVGLDWSLDEVKRAMWSHAGGALARQVIALAARHPGVISPYALEWARKGLATAASTGPADRHVLEDRIRGRLDHVLEAYDALIVPTVGATAFAAGEDYVDTKLVVAGDELEHFSDASLTPVFNIASSLPVVAVPSGWAQNGVPTGVQVVGRPYDDVTAFRVALAIERVRPAGTARNLTKGSP